MSVKPYTFIRIFVLFSEVYWRSRCSVSIKWYHSKGMAFLVISFVYDFSFKKWKKKIFQRPLSVGSVSLVPLMVLANKSIWSNVLTMLNVPDGSSLECLWGVFPHKKFPKESTPRGGGADWDRCHNRCCIWGSECTSQWKSVSISGKSLSAQ